MAAYESVYAFLAAHALVNFVSTAFNQRLFTILCAVSTYERQSPFINDRLDWPIIFQTPTTRPAIGCRYYHFDSFCLERDARVQPPRVKHIRPHHPFRRRVGTLECLTDPKKATSLSLLQNTE